MVLPLWKEISVVCKKLIVFTDNVENNAKMLAKKI